VLGVSLAGGETRTDWRRRPLTAAQVQYALDDVRYLLDLADHFAERLRISPNSVGRRRSSSISWRRLLGAARKIAGADCPG